MTSFQQQYHVTAIQTFNQAFPLLDFASIEPAVNRSNLGQLGTRARGQFTCQMLIQSLGEARLVIYRPDSMLAGLYSINRLWPIRLPIRVKSIQYVISALPQGNGEPSREMFSQEFVHKFYGNTFLLPGTNQLQAQDGPLFKKFALNTLLDTDRFAGVSGIQFVA